MHTWTEEAQFQILPLLSSSTPPQRHPYLFLSKTKKTWTEAVEMGSEGGRGAVNGFRGGGRAVLQMGSERGAVL